MDNGLGGRSTRCLSVAFVCFVVGHMSTLVCMGVRSQALDNDANSQVQTWTQVFIPVFVGNGLALAFEVLSIVFFVPIVRTAMRDASNRYELHDKSEELEALLPVVKSVANWNCCVPMLGAVPPIPMVALFTWFEATLAVTLDTGSPIERPFLLFVPVYILELFSMCHFGLIADHGTLSGLLIFCTTAFTILVPAKLEFTMSNMSWSIAFLPMFIWAFAALLMCTYIFLQNGVSKGHLQLSRMQMRCMVMYTLSLCFLVAGMSMLCYTLDVTATTTATSPSAVAPIILFEFTLFFFLVPVTAISWHESLTMARDSLEIPRLMGAGWDVDGGVENWALLGHVALKPGHSTIALCRLAGTSCAGHRGSEYGGVNRDGSDEDTSVFEPLVADPGVDQDLPQSTGGKSGVSERRRHRK